jgi:hypothetical protein
LSVENVTGHLFPKKHFMPTQELHRGRLIDHIGPAAETPLYSSVFEPTDPALLTQLD